MLPILNLKRELEIKQFVLLEAFDNFLNDANFILGNAVKAFELWMSEQLLNREVISVANGSDAIQLALEALALNSNNNVIVPVNAGGYASIAARNINVQVVPVEICEGCGVMEIKDALLQVNSNTKAIVFPHLYGNVHDLRNLRMECDARGIFLIEDCAQVFGGFNGDSPAGTFGHLSTFSFYPTKNLGAFGDAGAISTADVTLGRKIRNARQYGWTDKYYISQTFGKNSRMDELQARLLLVQKNYYLKEAEDRRNILKQLYNKHKSFTQITRYELGNMAHLNVIKFLIPEMRNVAIEFLQNSKIQTAIHYPIIDSEQIGLKNVSRRNLPKSRIWANSVLTIPLFSTMNSEEINLLKTSLLELDQLLSETFL